MIERMSLESRLEAAKSTLAELPPQPQQMTPKAQLTFSSKPVFGSHGITEDFSSKAAAFLGLLSWGGAIYSFIHGNPWAGIAQVIAGFIFAGASVSFHKKAKEKYGACVKANRFTSS